MAALRFHISRMQSLPLNPEKKQKEWDIIQTIANNNSFPKNLLHKLHWQMQPKTDHAWTKKKDKKFWTTFTYHSPKVRKITNLFKNTNIGIAFRITTSIHQLTKPTIADQTLDHEKSGVYQLTCNTCQRSYIGQTRYNLKSRFQEHARYIKNNDPQSAYALHILKCRHEYGNINDTMTLLKHINSPSLLLPYERMYIQLFHHNNQLIPEQHPNEQNPMFQLLYNKYHTSHLTWGPINSPACSKPVSSWPARQTVTHQVSKYHQQFLIAFSVAYIIIYFIAQNDFKDFNRPL